MEKFSLNHVFTEVRAGISLPINNMSLEMEQKPLLINKWLNVSLISTLTCLVTLEEVKEVVFDIGNDKAPGPDGYTAAFFKNQWATIGQDVYGAVLEFFTSGKLLKQINLAMIVLLPKFAHNRTVKDFRPIACLNVLYKVITKILARRMAPLLPDLIDPAQGAFVQGQTRVDNMLLAQHLILMDTLRHFSNVSGLTLNPTKSNIFIVGKYRDTSQDILDLASFPRGHLPVRYLGLPLASHRISEADFAPLLKSVDGFLSKWATMKLSYAGRLELTKKDSLWVKWVHNVYLKHEAIWHWQPKRRHSVFFKRLAYVRELLTQKLSDHNSSMEVAMQPLCLGGKLVPSKVYDLFRVKANPKSWMSFIWHSTIPPKCSFTMWLALRRRLPTKSNLEFLGLPMACTFCGQGLEDVDHLFFECCVSKQVWAAVKLWLRMDGQLGSLDRAIRWLRTFRREDAILKKMRKLALACTVFHLWKHYAKNIIRRLLINYCLWKHSS
ncbi:unnamed protein product [Cuscuta campestris]|uniref:Reverse transcriptase zinc-binding domain-containing protein n=1 Tax=Cuscuta campestris TaxID=132261 RepID=A0A484LPP7_9ASTE|nr:unnamed protein product [Cuscuta campestris]